MIKDNLERINKELPSGVKLVAVSKFHPVESLKDAYEAGQRVFGESRPQEFAAKVEALKSEEIEWHFIGHLQTNKPKTLDKCKKMCYNKDTETERIDTNGLD